MAPTAPQGDKPNLRTARHDHSVTVPTARVDYKAELDKAAGTERKSIPEAAGQSTISKLAEQVSQVLPESGKRILGIEDNTTDGANDEQTKKGILTEGAKPGEISRTHVEEFMRDMHRSRPDNTSAE